MQNLFIFQKKQIFQFLKGKFFLKNNFKKKIRSTDISLSHLKSWINTFKDYSRFSPSLTIDSPILKGIKKVSKIKIKNQILIFVHCRHYQCIQMN